jgi:hypothetical protein
MSVNETKIKTSVTFTPSTMRQLERLKIKFTRKSTNNLLEWLIDREHRQMSHEEFEKYNNGLIKRETK